MYTAKERIRQAAQTVKNGGTLNRRPYGGVRSPTAQRATQSPSFPLITEEEVREEALNRMLAGVYDAPTARVPASSYLTGGTSTPATSYAAGPQAGIVRQPEQRPPTQKKEPEKKPEKERNTLPWERFRGQSAEELEQLHTAAMADRDATYAQIGAVEREHAGPNSTYGASAGLYKPREENPFSSSAATSGGWVSQVDRELNSLRLEAGRQQDTVNDLAAAHYHRENQQIGAV